MTVLKTEFKKALTSQGVNVHAVQNELVQTNHRHAALHLSDGFEGAEGSVL